jgi:hypothetical protein
MQETVYHSDFVEPDLPNEVRGQAKYNSQPVKPTFTVIGKLVILIVKISQSGSRHPSPAELQRFTVPTHAVQLRMTNRPRQ